MIKYTNFCRLCHHTTLKPILDLGLNHVQGNFLTKNNPNPPKRKIPNVIIRCDPKSGGCGLVQSNITVPPEILFSSYFYRSSVNETMRIHLKSVVDKMLKFIPEPDMVMDVAANDLELLRNYPEKTEKWGVDPNDIILRADKGNIKVINDFFPSSQIPNRRIFSQITCLAVFYDIDNPLYFMKEVMSRLKDDGVFCMEVMYLPSIIKNLAFDSFLGEHLTHWSLFTLEKLVKMVGGKIISSRLTPTNGGSILIFATHKNCNKHNSKEEQDNILEIKKAEFDMVLDEDSTFTEFESRVSTHRRDLNTLLCKLKRENKKICLYGVSTKSNVLVESCFLEKFFTYGIERSEEKVGGQTLWGLPIKSEEEARKEVDENTVWMIGPYFFKQNLLIREKDSIEKGLTMLLPLPIITLINKENYDQHTK